MTEKVLRCQAQLTNPTPAYQAALTTPAPFKAAVTAPLTVKTTADYNDLDEDTLTLQL